MKFNFDYLLPLKKPAQNRIQTFAVNFLSTANHAVLSYDPFEVPIATGGSQVFFKNFLKTGSFRLNGF
jgi:hypothetical protein